MSRTFRLRLPTRCHFAGLRRRWKTFYGDTIEQWIHTSEHSSTAARQTEETTQTTMRVRKRNGSLEPVDINKIVRAISRCTPNLPNVDVLRIATKTISGLYDGATTQELDKLSIQTAASLIFEEPEYSRLGARLLNQYIEKEVRNQEIHSFSQSIAFGVQRRPDRRARRQLRFGKQPQAERRDRPDPQRSVRIFWPPHSLRSLSSEKSGDARRYRDPAVLLDACRLRPCPKRRTRRSSFINLFSSLEYVPSTPTLFNSGTQHEQLSSCFLLDSPQDSLESIYKKYSDVAMLSKFSGGIGIAYHRVRSQGSLIRGTNGHSNGIVPWLKTLDSSVAAVNQGGKRKGACCVYLETWHADIEDFLELRDNTGDEARRTHNLNIANWIPDLFMRRVEADGVVVAVRSEGRPAFPRPLRRRIRGGLHRGRRSRPVRRADQGPRSVREDDADDGPDRQRLDDVQGREQPKSNQTARPENVVHLSNLCTEIIEVTSDNETAVCNLGSINVVAICEGRRVRFRKASTQRPARRPPARPRDRSQLLRDPEHGRFEQPLAEHRPRRDGPAGCFLPAASAVRFGRSTQDLGEDPGRDLLRGTRRFVRSGAERRAHIRRFAETRAAQGDLQFDLWGVTPEDTERWDALREKIKAHGLRNSLMIAIAPTATIASIAGCYECIEPQVSNLFKRETLSGDFVQVNKYLVKELKAAGLWTDEIRNKIKLSEGSVQDIEEFNDELKAIYRTAWEIPMRSLIDMAADRGAFIDQSQSLNLFMESPNIGKLSSMYMYAWQKV